MAGIGPIFTKAATFLSLLNDVASVVHWVVSVVLSISVVVADGLATELK